MKRPANRQIAAVMAIVALIGVAVGYVVYAAHRDGTDSAVTVNPPATASGGPAPSGTGSATSSTPLALDTPGQMLFVDSTPGPHYGQLSAVSLADPTAPRAQSGVVCQRVYAAAGHVLCLRLTTNLVGQVEAVILDTSLHELRTIPVSGIPSRARISRDGRIASWTVFVHGDSYTSVGFSTRTSVLDLESGKLEGSLESFTVFMGAQKYTSPDVNFWGVTVAADDNTFYATMATKGKTYLVRGDLRARTLRTLRENVECPSLSPDGTRIAFKKKTPSSDGRQPWRLYVLDLATMTEHALAETRGIDDQAAWLDDHTLAYSLPETGITSYDVWTVQSDGSGTPKMLLEHATSPAAVN